MRLLTKETVLDATRGERGEPSESERAVGPSKCAKAGRLPDRPVDRLTNSPVTSAWPVGGGGGRESLHDERITGRMNK